MADFYGMDIVWMCDVEEGDVSLDFGSVLDSAACKLEFPGSTTPSPVGLQLYETVRWSSRVNFPTILLKFEDHHVSCSRKSRDPMLGQEKQWCWDETRGNPTGWAAVSTAVKLQVPLAAETKFEAPQLSPPKSAQGGEHLGYCHSSNKRGAQRECQD